VRILVVVQRYGSEIAGGAEQLIRGYSERLTRRGHEVEILTSCAFSYVDWANAYPPGSETDGEILVHRLPVERRRRNELFGPLDARVRGGGTNVPLSSVVTDAWSRMLGPDLPDLLPWLELHVSHFDLVVFSGYMFPTTTVGLPHIAGAVPTVVQPVVHDEPALRLPTVRPLFEHAAGICALTDEEAQLIQRRFRPEGVMRVVGGGVEDAPPVDRTALDVVEDKLGIRDRRFIISVGRIEEGKGTSELVDYFEEYVTRRGSDLQLVLVGQNAANLRRKRNVVFADFVPDQIKWGLLADAELLVQPSYFESFSLSLVEGWRQALPALVQGRCDVLAGQVGRSGGGLTYRNFAEFDTALDLLAVSADLRHHLGRAGQHYARRYDWDEVIDAFELLADEAIRHWTYTDGRRQRAHEFQGAIP